MSYYKDGKFSFPYAYYQFGFTVCILETIHNALASATLKLFFSENKIDVFCLMRFKTLD